MPSDTSTMADRCRERARRVRDRAQSNAEPALRPLLLKIAERWETLAQISAGGPWPRRRT
jgi:hypothetical protein